MTLDDRTYDWREATTRLVRKLDHAHCAVEELASALDKGDDVELAGLA